MPPRPPARTPLRPPSPPPRPAPGAAAEGAAPDPAETQRILATARDRFFAHGFNTITMDDLARDLGMSKKTLYRHFSHKEALLEAILDGLADSVASLFAPRPMDPASSVPSHLRTVIAGISERLAAIQPAFLVSLKRFAPRQFERLDQLRRRNLERHLIPLLQAGQRRGEIRRDLDPAFAVEILVQTLHGLLDPDVLHRLERTPAQAVSGAVDLVLRGLLEPASAASPGFPRP